MYFFSVKDLYILAIILKTASSIYFPMNAINMTIPITDLRGPIPPLTRLNAIGEFENEKELKITYQIVEASDETLVYIENDAIRLNRSRLSSLAQRGSGSHSFVVNAVSIDGDSANLTIGLQLIDARPECENLEEKLCFWDAVSFQIAENQRPAQLCYLPSDFLTSFCGNYSVTYEIVEGSESIGVKRMENKKTNKNSNSWLLSTKTNWDRENFPKMKFGVNCSIAKDGNNSKSYLRNFNMTIIDLDDNRPKINLDVYQIPLTNIIQKGSLVAKATIYDGDRTKTNDFNIWLENDEEDILQLKCDSEDINILFPPSTHYECVIKCKREFYIKEPYVVHLRIDSKTRNKDASQKIILAPPNYRIRNKHDTSDIEVEKLDLFYPDVVSISRYATFGTRVAEPNKKRATRDFYVKFKLGSLGPFNITHVDGIVYVSNPALLRNSTNIRVKVVWEWIHSRLSYREFDVEIVDTYLDGNICSKIIGENGHSCSEKESKEECFNSCGVGAGSFKEINETYMVTSGCQWRANKEPEKLSRKYQTCSPNLSTCPDGTCDALEKLYPSMCPQDCTEELFGSAMKNPNGPGVYSGTEVCSCSKLRKCTCATPLAIKKKGDGSNNQNQHVNYTVFYRDVNISAIKAPETDQCGIGCLLSLIGGSVILILLIAGIILTRNYRRLRKRCPHQRPLKEDIVNVNYEDYVERPGDSLRSSHNPVVNDKPEYYDKKWEFPRHRLSIEETIGEGEFGKVLRARADGIAGNEGSIIVAVKTLKDNAKESELADLVSEYQLLKEVDHPNVIHLLGACTTLDGPIYVIIEYAKYGSLRNHLRKSRQFGSEHQINEKEAETSYMESVTRITPKDILIFAWQIAKGMSYLTEMKLVHRDLAARNVLVADGLICKISDFGLTRDIYEDDTYLKRSKGRVPVKWMALESLDQHIYTTKSDVWSYGIVLWELVTSGASPYPGIAVQNLFHLLKSGYRMERPQNCSNELYQIMRSCWRENPKDRHTFKELVDRFEKMLSEGKDYLDLNPRIIENKTYFSDFLNDIKDEEESFLPATTQNEKNEIMKWTFEIQGGPKIQQIKMCHCPPGKCVCVTIKYENENVTEFIKPKYENEIQENNVYVKPSEEAKLVNSCQGSDSMPCEERIPAHKLAKELANISNSNIYVESSKKELCDVKKI